MDIYIYNLDRSTDEDDLRDLFEEFGEVESITKRKQPDPEKDTFSAIVNMPFKSEAEDAIRELHGESIDGRDIRVLNLPDASIEEARTGEEDDGEAQEWVFE